uniref:DUF834 domain-containing protein n=1 Tax=Oryza glumipatula TaxID=40148 RepID=A0A0E0BS43_9ORYZ
MDNLTIETPADEDDDISYVPSPSDSETDEPAMAFTSSRGVAATALGSMSGGAAAVLGESAGGSVLLRGAWSRWGGLAGVASATGVVDGVSEEKTSGIEQARRVAACARVHLGDAGAEVGEDAIHCGSASKARSRPSAIFGDFACDFACVDEEKHRGKYVISQDP